MESKFGEFLYVLRKEKGMTQMELADRLGITNKAVSKWETGEAFPETGQLVPLANILGVSIDELLRGERNAAYHYEEVKEPSITEAPVKELKPMTKVEAYTTAGAIALILIGVLVLITLAFNDISYGIYVSILIFMTAVAVVLLVYTGLKRSIRSAELSQEDIKKGNKLGLLLSISIGIIILSATIIVSMSAFNVSEAVYLPIFFAVLIAGVTSIVLAGIQWDAFSKTQKLPSDEQPLTGKAKRIEEAASGTIMLTATAIFLLLGFLWNLWHPAWVVFPVGGILCGIVSNIIRNVKNK